MKKIFKKAFVVLGIMGMGLGSTSCDSETLQALLPIVVEVLQNSFGQANGNQVAYSGTMEITSYKCENNEYDPNTWQKATTFGVDNVTATVDAKNGVVTIQIADFKIGDTTVSGFSFNTNYNAKDGTVGAGKDAYYTGLTCTVNGHAASEEDYACICGTISEGTIDLSYIDFYTAGKKFEGKYSGKVQQQPAQ